MIVNNLAQLSGLAAETDRLDALREAMLVSGGGREGQVSGGGGRAQLMSGLAAETDRLDAPREAMLVSGGGRGRGGSR